MLGSPDPVVRDETAYEQLAERIRVGAVDDRLVHIGDVMADRFGHPEIQARTFAPLILAAVARRSVVDISTLRRWRDAFAAWWLAEDDLRGWDARLGWLHAVAHGADLVGALGVSLTAPEASELLVLVAERVTAPTDYRYAQMEEDRLARAVGEILARDDLATATKWLGGVDRVFSRGGPGPVAVAAAHPRAVV